MNTLELEPLSELQYHSLLRDAGHFCTAFLLIVKPGIGLSSQALDVLDRLNPYEISVEEVSEWPGTRLLRGVVEKHLYRLDASSLDLIIAAVSSPFDWQQPALPEDLCLLREDGSALLVTIAHEQDAFLQVSENELPAFSTYARQDSNQ
jgi:hypothetical protein